MDPNIKEYDAGTTNAPSCYIKMNGYGKQGYRPIIPPTPVTIQPSLFMMMKPDRQPEYIQKPIIIRR